MMKNKWLICALGILSFVTLSAGSCDEDDDVDCDEETGAWTKCEDGKLKQCYKSELSGDYIYKSEKCESGECASETACLIEETDGGITPAPTDGGVIDVGDGGTVVSDGGYVVIDDAGTDPDDAGTDPEMECNEANAGKTICKEFTPGGKDTEEPLPPEAFVLTCMQQEDSTWAFSLPMTCPSKCNEDFTDCGEVECTAATEGRVICVDDGQHAYYATCTLLVNPSNPSETSHAYEPATKCEVYGSNKCLNDRYCASPEGGMSGEIPCGPENQGQVICVDVGGKGMIETCDEWSMQGSDQKEWFFNTSPEDCANGCNEAHNGCK